MEDSESLEYRWYLNGCRQLGFDPLDAHEFWFYYRRYRRCKRILEKYERRDRKTGIGYHVQNLLLDRLMNGVREQQRGLESLAMAVTAGRDAEGGDAGAPVRRSPRTPVLVGCGAKMHPDLDPEPYWRDP